jgi:hypothetical protein
MRRLKLWIPILVAVTAVIVWYCYLTYIDSASAGHINRVTFEGIQMVLPAFACI